MRSRLVALALLSGLGLSAHGAGDEDDCRKGATDLRLAACNRIIDSGQLRPDALADMLHQRGRAKRDVGDVAGAIDDYNRSLAIQPRRQGIYQDRARAKRELGDLDGAIADLTRVIESEPRDSANYVRRGDIKRSKDDVEGAMADADRAIELNPKNPAAHNLRGNVNVLKAEFAAAATDYGRAAEISPRNVVYLHNLGQASRELGDSVGALKVFERAVELDPRYAYSYFVRGLAKREKGDLEGTIADMNRALELDPTYHEAIRARGVTHYLLGRYAQAAADLKQAHSIGVDTMGLLMMHHAQVKSGGGDAIELMRRLHRSGDIKWPQPLIGLYLGSANEAAVRTSTEHAIPRTRSILRCQADYHIGKWLQQKGESARALAAMREARTHCPKTVFARSAAIDELRRAGE